MTVAVENNPPKPGKNKFVSWNPTTNTFDEFPIKIGVVQIGNYLEIDIAPPVRRAGFLSHNKQIYFVPLHDIIRNHFNVTKPYIRTAEPITSSSRSSAVMGTDSSSGTDQPGPQTSSGDDIDEKSSLYWQEQVQSLLYSDDL